MYLEIIRYKLVQGVSDEYLTESARDICNIWMKKQAGFISWDVNKSDQGWVDLVRWESKEYAQLAQKAMKDIPEDHNWLKCYDMSSVSSEKVTTLLNLK